MAYKINWCPNCGYRANQKQVGDVPYAEDAIYSRHLVDCENCLAFFDIFTTQAPKINVGSGSK